MRAGIFASIAGLRKKCEGPGLMPLVNPRGVLCMCGQCAFVLYLLTSPRLVRV